MVIIWPKIPLQQVAWKIKREEELHIEWNKLGSAAWRQLKVTVKLRNEGWGKIDATIIITFD